MDGGAPRRKASSTLGVMRALTSSKVVKVRSFLSGNSPLAFPESRSVLNHLRYLAGGNTSSGSRFLSVAASKVNLHQAFYHLRALVIVLSCWIW